MTTPPKAQRYNIGRAEDGPDLPDDAPDLGAEAKPVRAPQPDKDKASKPASAQPETGGEAAASGSSEEDGLTRRQLRMARRVARLHKIEVETDQEAVQKLRAAGIDPFQRKNVLGLVTDSASAETAKPTPNDTAVPFNTQLPQIGEERAVAKPQSHPPMPKTALEERASEIRQMQKDIARRRRKNLYLMAARLVFFVGLPTLIAGLYFYKIATPMYATESNFVIQQASPQGVGSGGMGGLFQGTPMATQQDSMNVQSYLTSIAAMKRLDEDLGFKEAFTDPSVDPLQRLQPGATAEEAYAVYKKRVVVSYDPTEGLIRMEVSAPTPELSFEFNEALYQYAEQKVDSMTSRMRDDQMESALEIYRSAEQERQNALRHLTELQASSESLDPVAESGAFMSRIQSFEADRDRLNLELASLLANPRPNQARVEGVRSSIAVLNEQIRALRSEITQSTGDTSSRSVTNSEIREAEENYQVRLMMVQEALTQMETARIEAHRQSRYLLLSVPPILPESPSYPREFENTAVAFLIFFGIYIVMSLTAAVLREQVSS